MKHILVVLCLVGFGLVATLAQAADLRVTCTGPTAYTDNTAIPAAKLPTGTYQLYGALQGQPKLKLASGATCAFTRTSVAVGTQEYYTTYTLDNIESDPSITVSSVVTPPKPNPPTNTAVLQLVAYEMRGTATAGDLRMVSVGYVAEGTSCLQTQATVSGVTYQQVSKSSVDLYNALTKLPPVTWARCG
jgi:hypothetical protein